MESNSSDKIKHIFFQSSNCISSTEWMHCKMTLTKRVKRKKLDGSSTRMLRAILNKSWKQHSTKQQLYGYFPPISKTMQIRRTRHTGHLGRNKDKLIDDVLQWILFHVDLSVLDKQQELIYISSEWRQRVREIRTSGTT